MWYRFEKGQPLGIPRIKYYQVCYYNMTELDGDCCDELFFGPDDIGRAITYVDTIEDKHKCDRYRVFAMFDNNDEYEIKFEKTNGRYSNFYDGRELSKKEIIIRWFRKIKSKFKYKLWKLKRKLGSLWRYR